MEIESKDPNSDPFEFQPPHSPHDNTMLINSNYDQPQDELSTSNPLLDKSNSHQQNEIFEVENIQNHSLEQFKPSSEVQHDNNFSQAPLETIEYSKNENNQPLFTTEDFQDQQVMVIEETQSKGYFKENSLNTIVESVNEQTYNKTDETSVLDRSSIVQNITQVLPAFQDENQMDAANIETPKPTIASSTRKGLTNITNNFEHVSENRLKSLHEEIAAEILKPQDIKTNRPLRPYSLNALEEGRHEPFELQQRHVFTDERPIKARGVYNHAETEIFTPIKRDRNFNGSGKKQDSGRALLSALGLQSSNKGKGADEERPSAGRKSFILNSEERPILGMDVYTYTLEEPAPVYQVPEKPVIMEEKSIREEPEENAETSGKKDLLESIQENLAAEKEETKMMIEEKPVEKNETATCLTDERPIRPTRQSLEPPVPENLSNKLFQSPEMENQNPEATPTRPVPENFSKNFEEETQPQEQQMTNPIISCLSDERPIRPTRQSLEPPVPENLSNKLFQGPEMENSEVQPQPLTATDQPLNERVKSKIWKVRQLAYEELANQFRDSPDESIFQEYAEDMIKFIADANPGAQEKAIEAFKAFAENYEPFKYEVRDILKTLIEKALAPGKPTMKKSATEAICSVFEKGGSQAVSDAIIDCLNHKNQKTVCAAVQVIFEFLRDKKIKTFTPLKPFLAHIEKLAGSSTAIIRTEALGFYKEAYLYFGRALQPSISKLKKGQQDELQAHFNNESIPDKMEIEQKDPKSFENKQQIDAYDAVEPVDIFKKFDQSWCDKVLEKTKWNEKKALLDDLLKEAVTAIRLANTPHHHIDDLLKRLMADNNITVVATVIKIYTALARGLRRGYNSTCKLAISSILAKLKDKRGQIIDEACKALDSFLYCVTLDEVIEDLKEILKDKAPEVKIHTMSLVEIGCEKYENMPDKVLTLYKALNQIIKKLVNDSAGEVRESAMRLLALWKAFLGDSVIKDNYNNIPQPKLSKINELAALLLASEDKTPAAPVLELFSTPTLIKTSSFVSDGMEEEETVKTPVNNTKSDPKKLGSNGAKPAAASGPKRNSLKNLPPVPPMTSKSSEDDLVSYLTLEDAQAKLIELGVPTSALEDINKNSWKEKVTGLSQLNTWVEYNIDLIATNLEYLFKYLKSKLKDWKESNLNILRETFNIIVTTVKNKQAALTKKSFSLLSQLVINNIYDNKYAHHCETIIYSYIEFVNPKSVLLILLNSLLQDSNKNAKPNPKLLIEMCNLFARLVEELTLKFVPLKEMVDFGKLTIRNQNPACRIAATSLFKSLYQQMGPKINDLISDINPQTLKILINEFKQVIPLRDVQCKIQFREDAEIDPKDLVPGNTLESMPRADISKDVEKNLRKLLDNDWKVRKECLDTLDTIVTLTGCRILPNGLNELVGILKSRLSDNNKSLAKSFISFTGKLAVSLGPDAKVYAKTLLPELIKHLSDKQAAIRQETLSSLNKFSAEIGSTILINHMLPFLSQENPEMRFEILNWILNSNDSLAKADIKQNVAPVLSALQDKTKDIRNLAEKLLERCINIIGTIPYVSALKNLKPATQQLLKPIVSKFRGENEIEVESLDTSLDQIQTSKVPKKTPSTLKSNKPSVPKLSLNNNPLNLNNILGNLNTSIHSAPTPSNHSTPRESLNNNLPHLPQNNNFSLQSEMAAFDKSGNIICIRGQKDKRREEENVNPWPTNELQDTTLEKLKSQLRAHVCSELYQKMFSIDFRNHLGAIFLLYKALGGEFKGTIDILDLIFKWFFVRLWYNSNPEIIMQSLEYLSHLISSLEHEQYTLFDFEANVLLSCLILKLGTIPQDLKGQLHKVLVKLTSVYSSSKVALTLLNGMNYNNPQTRIECIEVLAKIIKTCGADIISYKDLQVFGRLLKHNDINIRLKSLMLLVEAGKHIGDQIVTLVGRDAPPSLLEELKNRLLAHQNSDGNTADSIHLHEEADSRPLYNPISPEKSIEIAPPPVADKKVENPPAPDVVVVKQKSPGPGKEQQQQQQQIIVEKKSEVGVVVEQPRPAQNVRQSKPAEEQEEQSMIQQQQQHSSYSQKESRRLDEEKFQKGLQILVQGTVSSKLDILVFIHELAISDEEENKRFLRKKANLIFEALRLVLSQVFEKSEDEIPSKFLLYYINMIHKLCSIRLLVKSTSEGYLRDFAEEILIRLLAEDEEKEEADEIKQLNRVENDMLVKTLNSTMLRLLENAEPNDMFCILFDLLIKHRRINNYSKILGLIIKCVLKLTKALEQLVSVIKPEKILLKSHFYLLEFGLDPSKFGEDIGIKTIKTILNELAKIYREKIWEFYSHSIQLHPQQDNYIHRWLTVILKPLVAESNSSSKKNQQGSAESEKNGPASADKYKPFDQGQQQEIPLIREIVDRLKTSGNLGESIRALHEALSQHPNHSLTPYLYNCTKSFTDFVKIELEKLRLQNNSRNNSGTKQDHQNSGNKSQIKVLDGQNRENVSAEKTFRHTNSLDRSPMANIEDLQHKISKLKARYGLIVKDENQNTVINTENETQKNASQDDYNPSGYDFGSALNRNIENQENIPLNGQSQAKSTGGGGSLLQKLSVSKFKTPSISKSMYTPN